MGGIFATGTGAERTGGGGGGSATIRSSRCGLPHLWQNSASSGSLAPHVQYSGTPSVWHVILIFAMSGSTLLVIADPAAPFLKSLARVPEEVRTMVGNDPERLKQNAPEADAILFA